MKTVKMFFFAIMVMFVTSLSVNVAHAATKVDSSSVTAVPQTTADQTVYNEGKEMLKSITKGGGDMLTNGYDIVVGQQRMKAFMYLFVAFLAIGAWIGFFVYYGKIKSEKPNAFFPSLVLFGLSLWFTIVVGLHFTDIFQGLVNPDYAAIQDIIKMFKK